MPIKQTIPGPAFVSNGSANQHLDTLKPPETLQGVVALPEKEWPQRHGRFLSQWRDEVVLINVSHKMGAAEAVAYDLKNIVVAVNGELSPFRTHRRLADFPDFVDTLKILINLTCKRHHHGNVESAIAAAIATAVRLFIWMHRKGTPALRVLTGDEISALVVDVAENGWWSVLEYDEALKSLFGAGQQRPRLVRTRPLR